MSGGVQRSAQLARGEPAAAAAAPDQDPFGIVDPSTQKGLADRAVGAVQSRLQSVRDAVVNRLQDVRDAVAPAQQDYQAQLADATTRQNATGQIIKDEHLQSLERNYGVDFGNLSSGDVDVGTRALLGDDATEGLVSGLSEGASTLSNVLDAIGPLADAVGLGFGIAGAYEENAAETKAEQEQQKLKQLQGALSAPTLGGGLGTGSTIDTRVDRQGGLANF